jgi:hypothetical protein
MAAPRRIVMPPKDGRPIPNPIRWACDHGHVHPSRLAAVKCNRKHRDRKAR